MTLSDHNDEALQSIQAAAADIERWALQIALKGYVSKDRQIMLMERITGMAEAVAKMETE